MRTRNLESAALSAWVAAATACVLAALAWPHESRALEPDPLVPGVIERITADSSDDGEVNVSDAVDVLLELFRERGHIAPPVGTCAADSTPDDLPCAAYRFCP